MSDPQRQVLAGRVALITGANQGLGFEIAKHYLDAGASVAACARNAEHLAKAEVALHQHVSDGSQLTVFASDVSVPRDCTAAVERTLSRFGHLDILVNNAGIYGPKGAVDTVDWDEWAEAVQINLFGSVLMCRAALEHFKMRKHGKIIQLSGGGATNPLPMLSAYAASKAAVVRFAETLAEEVRELGIDVNAIAPGALNTRMLEEVLAAGPEQVGEPFYRRAVKQKEQGGASLANAARLAVFLGSRASDGITGKLISAVWDPWLKFPAHLGDLSATDVYTLRRILPADRGLPWGDKQ